MLFVNKYWSKSSTAGLFITLFAMFSIATSATAQDAAHIKKDAERHKAMASAHSQAAQCLESGKKYDDCMKQLQAACKGLGIGKHCGMRHEH
jgi:hypothetical protein